MNVAKNILFAPGFVLVPKNKQTNKLVATRSIMGRYKILAVEPQSPEC
jgi:hypothetical protein